MSVLLVVVCVSACMPALKLLHHPRHHMIALYGTVWYGIVQFRVL
jgi:hypothetical protein